MKNLIKKLKEFDEERRNALRTPEKWDDEAVAKCFVPIAKYVLLNGYFLVNDKYIIDLGAIELYYHEEDGNIKDHIMYHTNEHPSKSKVYKLNNGFPYFKIGSFNLHQSGIDVTFENDTNCKDKYRASFLIRSYRVIKKDNIDELKSDRIPFDHCSTHIFDDMFYEGISFDGTIGCSIQWINYEKGGGIKQVPRINVAEYKGKDEAGKIIFEKVEASKDDYCQNKEHYFKYGTKYYKKDMREWQFIRTINTSKANKV